MKGFDEYNLLLLPPRVPGELLPKQLLDYYEESKQEETVNEITIPVLNSTSSNGTENIMTETSKEISKEILTDISKTFIPKDESSKGMVLISVLSWPLTNILWKQKSFHNSRDLHNLNIFSQLLVMLWVMFWMLLKDLWEHCFFCYIRTRDEVSKVQDFFLLT